MHTQLVSAHISSEDFDTAFTAILDGRPRPLRGVSPRGIPKVIAAMLEYWEGADGYPATVTGLLEWLSGEKMRLQVIRPAPGEPPGKRALTDRERYRLGAEGVARCRWRYAVLRVDDGSEAGGMIAAAVGLTWLPARLPFGTCADLDAGKEPAGRILDRLPGGVHRVDRGALPAWTLEELTGQRASVTSSAALRIDGHGLVAIAEERLLAGFTESLAG